MLNPTLLGSFGSDSTQSSSAAKAIAFIDPAIDDYLTLVNGVVPGTQVVILDSHRDGVEQITETLQRYDGLTAVHLVSHGSPGSLRLGNGQLSLDTLDRYTAQLQQWGNQNPNLSHAVWV